MPPSDLPNPDAASASPLVGVAMGSESDLEVMQRAADALDTFAVPYEMRVLSAHRTPDAMHDYARTAAERGLQVIIAGAGKAAHLPGMIAASTPLPVLGVPVPTTDLGGMDSLLSVVQMPGGVPVGTLAIGGAQNAGLLAVQILATSRPALMDKMTQHKRRLREKAEAMDRRVSKQTTPS